MEQTASNLVDLTHTLEESTTNRTVGEGDDETTDTGDCDVQREITLVGSSSPTVDPEGDGQQPNLGRSLVRTEELREPSTSSVNPAVCRPGSVDHYKALNASKNRFVRSIREQTELYIVPGATTEPVDDSTNTDARASMPAATKQREGDSAKSKKRKRAPASNTAEKDGERCSICLDPWTSKGKHRICTLHCGHLFGKACIERWLEERRSCPQCGAKVGSKGSHRVIPLFLSNLTAKDTGELETAMVRLEEEKRLRKQCEAERIRLAIENESLKDRIARLTLNTISAKNPDDLTGRPTRQPPGAPACCSTPRRTIRTTASTPLPELSSTRDTILSTPGLRDTSCPSSSASGTRRSSSSISLPASSMSMNGSSSESGFGEESGTGGLRFQHALSKGLRSGRVAEFAGGSAGALLVSQEFGSVGGARGSMRHGVTKCSLADFRHQKNIFLHREQVRDVKFSAQAGGASYVLTTSFDRTLKVCDLRTDSVVIQYSVEGNGWSCQWSATDSNQMFCGIVDSSRTSAVALYDLRSTAGAVRKLRAAANQQQPVHSVCHIAEDELLCATMGGVWAWGGGTKGGDPAPSESGDREEPVAEQLQIQAGPCCSLSQSRGSGGRSDMSTRRFLVSTRGSSASHAIFGLEVSRTPSDGAVASERTAIVGDTAAPLGTAHGAWRGGAGHSLVPETIGSRRRRPVSVNSAWAGRWKKLPCVAQGHQSRHALSRSLLWAPIADGGSLFIAGGDEGTNQPWIWDASTGQVCRRLTAHASPVLDVALLEENAWGVGLLAAVSQGEMKVYQTSSRQ